MVDEMEEHGKDGEEGSMAMVSSRDSCGVDFEVKVKVNDMDLIEMVSQPQYFPK